MFEETVSLHYRVNRYVLDVTRPNRASPRTSRAGSWGQLPDGSRSKWRGVANSPRAVDSLLPTSGITTPCAATNRLTTATPVVGAGIGIGTNEG